VTIVFDESRDLVRRALEKAFDGEQGVEIVQEPEEVFLHRPDVDAYLLNRPLAHYNYVLQVPLPPLSVPPGTPRLVSSAPLYRTRPAHFPDFTSAPYVIAEPVFSPDLKPDELTFEDIMQLKFGAVFEAVKRLNASGTAPRIGQLGSYLEHVFKIAEGVSEDAIQRAIRGPYRAYRDHRSTL
jgi:hypothetical protein